MIDSSNFEYDYDTPVEVWEEYNREKQKISARVTSSQEYDAEVHKLCRRIGISFRGVD